MIENFHLVYRRLSFNKDKKNIMNLLPIGVSWLLYNKQYYIENKKGIIAVLLRNKQEIALIEEPFNMQQNKATIINEDGLIKWNISNLLMVDKKIQTAIFSDVYYILDELNFFININKTDDFRFAVNSDVGNLGDLILCK